MSVEQYDEAIYQSLDDNGVRFYTMEYQYPNPQEGDSNINRDDGHIQDPIADLTAYFDETFLKKVVNEQTTSSKISMATGCSILEEFQNENKDDIFISSTNDKQSEGVLKEIFVEVWQISEEEARRTLEFTFKINH